MHRFLKTYFYPVLPKPWGISRGGRDSNGRIAYWRFRLKAWAYELADFFFPKPYSLAALAGFEFQDGLVMVDYGCGPGRYLLQASRLVGPRGRVYAVDILPLAIQSVQGIKDKFSLLNVVPTLASGYSSTVPDHVADLIYALDVLHSIQDPSAFLAELHRIAKPGCELVLNDGYQSRKKTMKMLSTSPLWRLDRQEKSYVKCVTA